VARPVRFVARNPVQARPEEDREGEAIAWHLLQVLKPKVPVHRMVFHEITKDAIRAAVDNTRELDLALVDAQETRRVLDRLYGWDVSPVLWRKVGSGREGAALSAGRVQSAATRMVVERERERMAFVSAIYWDVEALAGKAEESFTTRLARIDGASHFTIFLRIFLPVSLPIKDQLVPAGKPIVIRLGQTVAVKIRPTTVASVLQLAGWILVPIGLAAMGGVLMRKKT